MASAVRSRQIRCTVARDETARGFIRFLPVALERGSMSQGGHVVGE